MVVYTYIFVGGLIAFLITLVFVHRERITKLFAELAGDFIFAVIITILILTFLRHLNNAEIALIFILAMFFILIIRYVSAKEKGSAAQTDIPKDFSRY